MAVNDKPGMSGQLVVERAAGFIGCLRLPVDAARASQRGLLVNVVDEGLANSELAPCGGRKKILQIADRSKPGGGAVKQIMSQANYLSFMFRDHCKYRLDGIEETPPGCLGNFSGQSGSSGPSIESVVAIPEREPLIKIFGLNGSYYDTGYNVIFRHRTDFLERDPHRAHQIALVLQVLEEFWAWLAVFTSRICVKPDSAIFL